MIDAGMNVARLNFSHGDHTSHGKQVEALHEAMKQRPDKQIAIMLDTKGPEIRSGKLAGGADVQLVQGTDFTLKYIAADPKGLENKGDATWVCQDYPNLAKKIEVGKQICIDDGLISLTVKEIKGDDVVCTINNTAMLGETKGINLPGTEVDLPAITPKDKEDLIFGVQQGVDLIAASFVRKADDVKEIRKVLGLPGRGIMIFSKIESQEGLDNFDEILEVSDGIMVARGDLGIEIPIQKVYMAQKMIIKKCNAVGKPVITATQMLESMCGAPRPTRAEASDVANAVLDGTDAVMLSGETAGGGFPLEAVTCMVNTCREAEKTIDYQTASLQARTLSAAACPTRAAFDAAAASAAQLSLDAAAKAIVVVSDDEKVVQAVTKFRPACPVVLATSNEQLARQSTGYFKNVYAAVAGDAAAACTGLGLAAAGDSVVTFTNSAVVSLVTL